MSSLSRALRFLVAGYGATLRHLGVALPVCLVLALITGVGDVVIAELVALSGVGTGPDAGQTGLIATLVGWLVWDLASQILVGPLVAATGVFVARAAANGKPAGLYPALNFALARYKRMFVPHMRAWVAILVGMQVLVPGLLYWMMYAFVDAVAALDDHPDPRARSRQLTLGRRGTILWMASPFILFSVGRIFFDFQVQAMGTLVWTGYHGLVHLFTYGLAVSYATLYLARMVALDKARAEAEAAPA